MVDVKKIDVKKAEKYGWKVEEDCPDEDFIYLLKTGEYYLADNCALYEWERKPFDYLWADDVAAYWDISNSDDFSVVRDFVYCDEDFESFVKEYNLGDDHFIYVENADYIIEKGLYSVEDFYRVLPTKEEVLAEVKDLLDEDEYEEFSALAEKSFYSAMSLFESIDYRFMKIFSAIRRVPMKKRS